MLIFSSASSFLAWTNHLHQQDLGDRGKMLLLPLQVAPKCLTQHSIHPAAAPTWRLVLQSEFEPFPAPWGWKPWDGESRRRVASKTGWSVPRQEGSVPQGSLVPIPKHLVAHLLMGSRHPSHSCFPYLVFRSSDPVRFPRSCHGDEM